MTANKYFFLVLFVLLGCGKPQQINGEPCTQDSECLGSVCYEGICSERCSTLDTNCSNGGECTLLDQTNPLVGICLKSCIAQEECSTGYCSKQSESQITNEVTIRKCSERDISKGISGDTGCVCLSQKPPAGKNECQKNADCPRGFKCMKSEKSGLVVCKAQPCESDNDCESRFKCLKDDETGLSFCRRLF